MSDRSARVRVCDTSPAVTLDLSSACQPHPSSRKAPVDEYYQAAEAVTLVGEPALLANHAVLGRLLLLGHVGVTENFVRSVLVRLLAVCPYCRSHAGSQSLPFASVHYYSIDEVAHGLFDSKSLASAVEIRATVKKLTNIDLPPKGPLQVSLTRFDELCHLRHAAVHAHGSIGTGNATALGLLNSGGRLHLNVDLPRVHEAALICRSFVQELNQHLFQHVFLRWRDQGLLVRDYSVDGPVFKNLYGLFRSMNDPGSRKMSPKAAYGNLLS